MGPSGKLPWWAGYPGSVGLGGMTAFASSVLTPTQQLIGFGLSALVFTYGVLATAWHFGVGRWFSRHVWWRFGRSPINPSAPALPRDPIRDEALADRTQELAREMLEQHAANERSKMQRHWAPREHDEERWNADRMADAAEQEAAAKRFHARLRSIVAEAERRGIRVKPWGVDRFDDHGVSAWGSALMLLATALRAGDYAGKILVIYWHDQALGTQDELEKRFGRTL